MSTPLDDKDRVGIQNAFFAVKDREERDKENRVLYTGRDQQFGLVLKEKAWKAYGGRPQAYLNFQKNFMAVKVAAPKPWEKNSDEVVKFNDWCLSQGIQIHNTTKGVIYQFV
jgi:hypothetical protein